MRPRKIGILTLHYGLNYGGVLQAYATKEILKALGYYPVIIDRIPDVLGRKYPLKRKFVHPFTQRAFSRFRREDLRPISPPVFSSEELSTMLSKGFYGVVVGSDQVWRKGVFSVNGDYYLIHQQSLNLKKVAFAASTGVAEWEYDEEETAEISAALKGFDGISVREEESVPMLKEHCGVDALSILDPTLLAPPTIYDNLCKKATLSGQGSLVTYILDWNEEKRTIIAEACKTTGSHAQHILPETSHRNGIIGRILHTDISVYDWVNQIATADFVVTDSFHGMAFSIIFNKQFVVMGNAARGMARFTSLLNQLNLTNRLTVGTLPVIDEPIDYCVVNRELSKLRQQGINFLHNYL